MERFPHDNSVKNYKRYPQLKSKKFLPLLLQVPMTADGVKPKVVKRSPVQMGVSGVTLRYVENGSLTTLHINNLVLIKNPTCLENF